MKVEGVTENDNETWEESESKVKDIIKERMGIDEELKIEMAHRIGKKEKGMKKKGRDGVNLPKNSLLIPKFPTNSNIIPRIKSVEWSVIVPKGLTTKRRGGAYQSSRKYGISG